MVDIVKRIEELMNLFDEGEVTTADKIKRPSDPFREFEERNPMDSGGLAKQRIAAKKYGMSLEKYQNLSQQEKTKLKDRAKREAAKAKGVPVDGVKVSKNIRKLPNGTFRFETEAGEGFNKIFPKGTTLKQAEDFRDEKLRDFGIEKGKNRPVNPDRGSYVGVKGQKHIKFNGVTYQVAVQRMKDKKMVTEKPYYTKDLNDAIKVRDQRVAKAPPKVEKGVINPDREKIQRKIDQRRFVQKVKEGRGVDFKSPKGYQVHHLLPLSLAGKDTTTRDLAVVNTQMNLEMAQFDKPIKNLTEEAFLLDYNGDRKNSLKRLDEINKELNDIVKKGVKKLGPEYKGLIGFNEIIPIFDANGQVFNFDFKPTGIDFKKSIAKNIEVPKKIKNISTKEIQKLVAEAPTTDLKGFNKPNLQKLASIGCPGKMMGGRVKLAKGENLSRCAVRGINKLKSTDPKNLTLADRANYQAIRKTSQGARVLKNILGPAALGIEALFVAPFAASDYASGRRGRDIALSALSLGLADQKLRRDELKEYFPEYGKGQKLLDLDERLMELERQQKGTRGQRVRSKGKLNIGLKKFDEAIKELPTEEALLNNLEKSKQAEMDLAEDEAKKAKQRRSSFDLSDPFSAAGGGIAKLAGVDSGPPPSSGPNSQGLQGLIKRGIKT
jgi:hypothetical protein